MKIRFSPESQKLAVAVYNFLHMNSDQSLDFIQLYEYTFPVDKEILKAEMTLIKNCFGKPADVTISDLTPLVEKTFPNVYRLLQVKAESSTKK